MAIYVEDEVKDVDEKVTRTNNTEREPVGPTSWDVYKENIQPLSQGRKIDSLMSSLTLIDDNTARQALYEQQKEKLDKELALNCDDKDRQLDLWCDHIDWLEQNVPDGGKVTRLSNAIEECIEQFYDKNQFKQDTRLFNIFMKFKRFCDEPIEIFGFMYANSICTLLARFYLNWSWQYEIKKNMSRAEALIKLGLSNLASPREVLEEAQAQLRCRINRMIQNGQLDDDCQPIQTHTQETQAQLASGGIRAALQTLKFRVNKRKGGLSQVAIRRVDGAVDHINVGGLRSQTRLVNGVRTAKTSKPGPSHKKAPNAPVQVLADENGGCETSVGVKKIPTAQRIQLVGRTGSENRLTASGSISGLMKR